MSDSDIVYWNRESGSFETEKVYGEFWLKFIYNNPLGKVGLWAMVKRAWFSHWYGKKMSAPQSAEKIIPFIKKYGLKTDDFLDSVDSFDSFNEFFYRKLKPSARPINRDMKSVVFPADGRHLVIPKLNKTNLIYAKGQHFQLNELLGDTNLAKHFEEGSMLISRLCPVDYHRFHFPCEGDVQSTHLIDGALSSVSPFALRKNLSIFWQNKRYLTVLENREFGTCLQLMVGATCVGSVHWTSKVGQHYHKGDEQGYFSFGGSCVITLFPPNSINFDDDILKNSHEGIETYDKVGESVGHVA
jgi:phosphatidylserine decarboxylase